MSKTYEEQLERYIDRAMAYIKQRDLAGALRVLDQMSALCDGAAAKRADLAAAQEEVARMREALKLLNDNLRTCPKCTQYVPLHGHAYGCLVGQALSAAPAGGQVLWRGEVHHREFCTLHLPREADDALGKPEFDKVVDVTIKAVTEQGANDGPQT